MTENSVQLIHRILAGEEEAFSTLVQKYQKRVHALAWRKIGDYHIAEDITQDTFLQVYKKLFTLRNPKQFDDWLYVIANRLCINWIKRNKLTMQSLKDTPTEEIDESFCIQYKSEQRQTETKDRYSEIVKKLLEKLPESECTVVTLFYLGEMTAKEIGKFLGVSVNTIKSWLHRARNRLKQDEPMIREAISNFQISPNVTENIMQEVARIKPATPSRSKPLIPLAFSAASAVLIVLLLGLGSQNLASFQEPYSLDPQSEMTVEIVDVPIVQNFEVRLDIIRNLLDEDSDEDGKDGDGEENSNQVLGDQYDFTKWALPENSTARFGKGRIIEIQYSPDGTQLAVATPVGVWIYDAQSGEELNLLTGHRSEVKSVVYSSDGTTIATGSSDGVRLWDAAKGNLKAIIKTNSVRSMTFAPDDTTIVTGGNDGPVHLWDVATGQRKAEFIGHTSVVSSITYSPDSTTIATASEDDTVRLWDAATGQHKTTLSGHTEWVTSVAYSPDGATIATASLDDTVRLWDATTGQRKTTLSGHQHYAISVVYSPDGATIASRGWDGIIFWRADADSPVVTLKGRIPRVSSLTYSPDGATIAIARNDGTAYLWDATAAESNTKLQPKHGTEPLFSGHKRWADCLTYSPDGTTIATGDGNGVHLWNASTGQHKGSLKGHTDSVHFVAYSPDGKNIVGGSWDGRAHLWNVNTGKYKELETKHDSGPSSADNSGRISRRDYVTTVVYSPDGTMIAGSIDQNTVHLWDAATGKQITTFEGHTDYIYSVAFSPDGATIASASKDKTVRLWDVATGNHITTLIGHTGAVCSVAFSPDGTTIATGAWYSQNTFRLWDAATGQPKMLPAGQSNIVLSIAYSPDGNTIATGNGNQVHLWDATTGTRKSTLTGHKNRVESVVFSPDGTTIATISMDGTMILWDVASMEEFE